MHQPGVEVRPLRQTSPATPHFNEVFLTDAVVPADAVVGDVHDGWRVTLTTLANERGNLGANTRGGGGRLELRDPVLTMPIREILAGAAADVDAPGAKLRGYHLLAEIAAPSATSGAIPWPASAWPAPSSTMTSPACRGLRAQATADARRQGRTDQATPLVSLQKLTASDEPPSPRS